MNTKTFVFVVLALCGIALPVSSWAAASEFKISAAKQLPEIGTIIKQSMSGDCGKIGVFHLDVQGNDIGTFDAKAVGACDQKFDLTYISKDGHDQVWITAMKVEVTAVGGEASESKNSGMSIEGGALMVSNVSLTALRLRLDAPTLMSSQGSVPKANIGAAKGKAEKVEVKGVARAVHH